MRFDTPRFGKPAEPIDWMEVIGPNGPERRRFTFVRSGRPGSLVEQEPEHDPERECVQRSIDGKVYIIQIQS